MTLATETTSRKQGQAPSGEHFVLHGVSWGFYEAVLREVGDQHVFVTYDRGEMELMSPSRPHEKYKKIIALMIHEFALASGLELESDGSMTIRRGDLGRGLEPDECFYVQNAARMREVRELNLRTDPPPDLVVELDYTHRTLNREAIYAALGVPEVWRFDLNKLEFLKWDNGRYDRVESSVVLNGLPRAEVERFVKLRASCGETEVVRAWRAWVENRHGDHAQA